MSEKKLSLVDLEVRSFVTADSRLLRGGLCSDYCNLDLPSECGDCQGGVGGVPSGASGCACPSAGCPAPTAESNCQCISLQGYTCPSAAGEYFC